MNRKKRGVWLDDSEYGLIKNMPIQMPKRDLKNLIEDLVSEVAERYLPSRGNASEGH